MTAAAMVAEFDDVAGWTADAVEELGLRYAIPAACRGSASPAALAWLAEACELTAGTRLLDVGAGAGGPAAWAAERFGVRPVLLEQTTRPDGPLSWSRRVEQVTAAIAARHRAARAYTLAARQGERLNRLFATGQISIQLIHAISQPITEER